jgi:hypothetical protein
VSTLAGLQRDFMASLAGEEPGAIAIHRRNVGSSRHAALAATYPVVRRLVGDGFFRALGLRYGEAHPSRSGDLLLYGDALARFVADDPFAAALPYLADVARLEWACHEALHAADAPPLDPLALARVPPERQDAIRFTLHPSVRLLACEHPVVALWEANQPERGGTPDRTEGADRVRVWRDASGVRVRRMEPLAWDFVCALAGNARLADAVDRLGDGASGIPWDALLAELGAEGSIAGFTLGEAAA